MLGISTDDLLIAVFQSYQAGPDLARIICLKANSTARNILKIIIKPKSYSLFINYMITFFLFFLHKQSFAKINLLYLKAMLRSPSCASG